MSSFNKRFLVAPMIALAASAMLVPEALAGGPNRAAPRPASVPHPAMSRKPTGTYPPVTSKPSAGSTTKKSAQGKKTPPTATPGKGKSKPGQQQQQQPGQQQQQQPGQQQQQQPGQQQQQQNGQQQQQQQTVVVRDGGGRGTWGAGAFSPPMVSPAPEAVPVGGAPADGFDVGKYLKDLAEAKDQREETRGKKLDNDQHERDLQRAERERAPSPGEEQQRAKVEEVRRALNAPKNEIYSAKAPNTLLEDLKDYPRLYQSRNPEVPLDADSLRKINVVRGQDTGNIGLLKKELSWPTALGGAEYQEHREALTGLAPKAVKEAMGGSVEADTLKKMKAALGELNTRLAGKINQLPNGRYIEAKRFLGQFDDAVKLLAKPHAGNYFNGKFSAQGKTVVDLVRHMSKEGLKFAPAVGGDEGAYESVHRALAAFDVAAHNSTAHASSSRAE